MLWLVGIIFVMIGIYYLSGLFEKREIRSSWSVKGTLPDTTDLTALASEGKLDAVVGRDDEIARAVHILLRRTKNNPLLLGAAGVGKTAIVEGLAMRIVQGDVPKQLKGKKVLSLDLNSMISDTKYRGTLEKKLNDLLVQLREAADTAILFIDEIHLIAQVGASEGSLNVADVLKPALARGEIRVIGATTPQEFERYIEPDPALARRLQPVLVHEPDAATAKMMLKKLKKAYEHFHGVTITDDAIEAAVDLSRKYIKDRQLPDKAIDLIDEAAAHVSIELQGHDRHAAGVIHGAARKSDGTVDKQHIREIVEDWTGAPCA